MVDVTKRYGDSVALKPFSLDIRAGELISLLGPSGCGKTTTLRIVAGFVAPTSGSVWVGNGDVTRIPPNRRGLGMVFQSYSLFPHMTVAQNVAFGLRMQGLGGAARDRRVAQMLDTVGLGEYAARLPAQLSGGQQQRVALARAMVTHPSVLLLDEPLGALDKNLRERMQFEIRDLQQRMGITTVMVTHDQEEAMTMSDRVAVMANGELLQVGTPRDIYSRPKTRFVSEFLGMSNLFRATVEGTEPGGWVTLRLEADGRLVRARRDVERESKSGTSVTLAVRPEKIVFREAGKGGTRCTVRREVFRGTHSLYELENPALPQPVIVLTGRPDPGLASDGVVRVDWAPEDAFILDGE